MQLITKIRIGALLLSAFLLIGGLKAALHPKLKLATTTPLPAAAQDSPDLAYPEFVTSSASRTFGIVRVVAGSGLALYVLFPLIKYRAFRR